MRRITVLLAAYNGADYLPRQLASLRLQDDPCFSVLMQDDGSTDATPALLAGICREDARFALAPCQGEHLGAKGNFFSLLRQVEGPVALCDQDDRWALHRLSRCRAALEAAEAEYGADTPLLVHSDCAVVDAVGNLLHPSLFRHQGWKGEANTLPRLLVQNNVTGCTTLLNEPLRRLVAAHADAAQVFMHDWHIALTAAAFGRIIFVPEALVDYCQHGTNVLGASGGNQLQRGVKALSYAKKARARIALTYDNAERFAALYGEALPQEARQVIDAYLATREMPWLRRVWQVQRMDCTMQSAVTQAGQILFG